MQAFRVFPLLAFSCFAVLAQTAPAINAGGVVNAASSATPVAPGSIASIYGTFLLTAPAKATGVPLPTSLSGLSLQFGTVAAPLFYASGGQVNAQVPWEATPGTSIMAVLGSQSGAAQTASIAPYAPGIFSINSQGTGQGAILDTSNRLVDQSNPAIPGSTYIQIFCTGLGPVSNQPATGAAAQSSPLSETPTNPEVTIGGVAATVLFSGLAPGAVGEYQVNVQVPAGVAAGNAVPVSMSMEGAASNTVTIAVGSAATTQSMISVMGGLTLNNVFLPLLFSWTAPIQVQGGGWKAAESVTVSLHGPLSWASAPPGEITLGSLTADATGTISGSLTIPYDNGITGPSVRIPQPGTYELVATGSSSGTVTAGAPVTLTVATVRGTGFNIDWGMLRGGRFGVFPGSLEDYSPERVDPEWVTVWRQAPVSAYGTIADNGSTGSDQASHITSSDYPGTHYAHDGNFFFTPDPAYQWLVGTANYRANAPALPSAAPDIIEIEWETLNGGDTSTYGQGDIGLPLWANPTIGDRLFVVGRWVLDAGHPDNGDNTEIHPPRLMATMRKRPTALSGSGALAAQVDIYVSGHGGGANQNDPPGLTSLLDQQGYGGGRMEDVLDAEDQQTYYQAGPAPDTITVLAAALIEKLTGEAFTGIINATAGPSAFPWGTPGVEQMPINDMDYDFDVPLPAPPPGATAVQMQVITHPQHTTAVNEVVTYGNPVNGLPTVAHVHLPYLGADNGIYARSLAFSWDLAAPPLSHFRVTLNNVQPIDQTGAWQMWADVSGQWVYLTGLAPGLLKTEAGQTVNIPGATYDVYAQGTDTVRVFVQGYQVACIDSLFGHLFGQTSYSGGLELIGKCGFGDDVDLGGALLSLAPMAASAGQYTVVASHFKVAVTVESVTGP